MAIKYEWEIRNLRTGTIDKNEKVVTKVIWRKTGTNEKGFSSYIENTTEIKYDPKAGFDPYSYLTEDKVLEWVKAAITPEEEEKDNEQIEKQIKNKMIETVDTPLPWVK